MRNKGKKIVNRERLTSRTLGALEVLSGIGMITVTYLGNEEAKNLAPLLYTFGGLAIVDGGADLIYGRFFSLINKAYQFVYNFRHKKGINSEIGNR